MRYLMSMSTVYSTQPARAYRKAVLGRPQCSVIISAMNSSDSEKIHTHCLLLIDLSLAFLAKTLKLLTYLNHCLKLQPGTQLIKTILILKVL
jgi:hypothetical protein